MSIQFGIPLDIVHQSQLILTSGQLSAVRITGSPTMDIVNLTGLGGTLVFSSGGQVYISGAGSAGSSVTVTGSSAISSPNFSGLGGTLVIRSGANTILISGAGGGGGITALTGDVTGAGAGTVNVNVVSLGNLVYGPNAGQVTLVNMLVNSSSPAGTEQSMDLKIAQQSVLKVFGLSDGNNGVTGTRINVNNYPLLAYTGGYASGAAVTLTNTATGLPLAFATSSPIVTLPYPGLWKVYGGIQLAYAGATVVAETAALKMIRLNNSSVLLTGSYTVIDLPAATTLTYTYGTVNLPPVYYYTYNANDVVTLAANVSAAPGVGSITVEQNGTFIAAERLG